MENLQGLRITGQYLRTKHFAWHQATHFASLECVPLLVMLSLIVAVLLTGQKKSAQALKSFFLLPMAIPVASVVLLWRLLFDAHGLWNHLLHMLSLGWKNK